MLAAESSSKSTPSPLQNRLVAALPLSYRRSFIEKLELVFLPLGQVLYESGDEELFVYFPTDSITSLLYVMENGSSAEIAVIGHEGIVGVAVFMGGMSTPSRAVIQSAGHAYRLSAAILKKEFDEHGPLTPLLLKYTQSLITHMAQRA